MQAQRDVCISVAKLGDVAVQAGDLTGAKTHFEESLAIVRKLARDNPTWAQAQRDVSVSLVKLGEVAVQAGDLAAAKAHFAEGLVIARKLAHDNPTSAQVQRDVVISLIKLGKTTQDRKLLREALDLAQRLARSGRLAPSDSGMVEAITRMIDAIP